MATWLLIYMTALCSQISSYLLSFVDAIKSRLRDPVDMVAAVFKAAVSVCLHRDNSEAVKFVCPLFPTYATSIYLPLYDQCTCAPADPLPLQYVAAAIRPQSRILPPSQSLCLGPHIYLQPLSPSSILTPSHPSHYNATTPPPLHWRISGHIYHHRPSDRLPRARRAAGRNVDRKSVV